MAPRCGNVRGTARRRSREAAVRNGRQRLLEAASRLFASKGYTATSVRDIVSAAGVTAPSLYHHFGNKEGLFLALVRVNRARVEAARQEVLAGGGTAAERLVRLSRTYVALRRELADFGWAIVRIVTGPRKATPRFDLRAMARERVRHFEDLVEEGVASGEFAPCVPHHVALALVGAIDIACHSRLIAPDTGESEVELDGMIAVILAGISRNRARKARRRSAAGGANRKSEPA